MIRTSEVVSWLSSVIRYAAVAAGVALALTALQSASAEEVDKGWVRSGALGLSLTSGNSDSVLFTGSLTGERIWTQDEWRLGANAAFGKTDGTKSTEIGHGVVQYKRLFDDRWYGTMVLDLLHDGVADIAYRFTVSPGLGYYFIKSEKTRLSGEVGPSFIREKLNGISASDYFGLRVAERFDHQLNERAKIWQSFEWLPQVDDFNNYIAIFEVGVEAALTETVSLRVVGQDRYDNQPAAGRKNNDISLVSALAFKF